MFRIRFNRLASSCMLAITLLFGAVSVTYGLGGGQGGPLPPDTNERYAGPAIIGTLVAIDLGSGCDQSVSFVGRCQKDNCTDESFMIDPWTSGIPIAPIDLLDIRIDELTIGSSFSNCRTFDPTSTTDEFLIIDEVTRITAFDLTGDGTEDMSVADVKLLYVVPN